jgi:hypothetical protein
MCVLPKGIAPEDDSDAVEVVEEEEVGTTEDGPWLFTLTKKVSYFYCRILPIYYFKAYIVS